MKNKTTIVAVILFMTVSLAGCGNAIPNMNAEQQALVVEYAAGELLKYDINYDYRLMEGVLTQEETAEELSVQETDAPMEGKAEQDALPVTNQESTESGSGADSNANELAAMEGSPVIQGEATPEVFLGLENIKIFYAGYETTQFYPNETSELYFVMNATEGNELLILKFIAENTSEAEANLDIAQKNIRFKIAIDGQEKNALTTMLLNDMGYYQGTLAGGESTELILACEIPEGQGAEIQTLSLIMKDVDASASIALK